MDQTETQQIVQVVGDNVGDETEHFSSGRTVVGDRPEGEKSSTDETEKENEQLKILLSAIGVEVPRLDEDHPGDWDLLVPATETLNTIEEYDFTLRKCATALAHRDEVIQTLSSNLHAMTENRNSLQAEYLAQAGQLVEQVQFLQDQLRQANRFWQLQADERLMSAQALSDAKNELLALQDTVRLKDEELLSLNDVVQQRDGSIQELILRLDSVTRDYTSLHEDNRLLKERLRETEEKIEHERQAFNSMLAELRGESAGVEKESAQLTLERLHKENEVLHQREVENAAVISQLMADVEAHRKGASLQKLIPLTSVASKSGTLCYTKEEHDSILEHQLSLLRAELDEVYGENINQMKQQMKEQHATEIDRIERELATAQEECKRASGQLTLWQQQYMMLSQQSLTNVDNAQLLTDAMAENVKYQHVVAELNARIADLTSDQLRKSGSLQSSTDKVSSQSDLDAYKSKVTEKIAAESRSLRSKVDELDALLSQAYAERDMAIARLRLVEAELDASRNDMKNARIQHTEELQRCEARTAADMNEISIQLASSKEQVKSLQLAKVSANELREEMSKLSSDHQTELVALKQMHDKFVHQMTIEHESQLQKLVKEYSEQLESLNIKLMIAMDAQEKKENENAAVVNELKCKLEQTQLSHELAVAQLREQVRHVEMNATEVLAHTPSLNAHSTELQPAVDPVVAHLAARLDKVTRERDSTIQSLQTVYRERVEMKQTFDSLQQECNALKAERVVLLAKVTEISQNHQTVVASMETANAELQKLRDNTYMVQLSDVSKGVQSVNLAPYSQSLTDLPDVTESDIVEKLRAEFDELQRLRREKDSAVSGSIETDIMLMQAVDQDGEAECVPDTCSVTNVGQHGDVQMHGDVQQRQTRVYTQHSASNVPSEDLLTLKQDYAELCIELVRTRETVCMLKKVDEERELMREHLKSEMQQLRELILDKYAGVSVSSNAADDASITESDGMEIATKAENGELQCRLESALASIEQLLQEKEKYERELEQMNSDHSNALSRIDALVQEHNILTGGRCPLSLVSANEITTTSESLVMSSVVEESGDEDLSPKRVVFDSQRKEIDYLHEQLHSAACEIESLTADKTRLTETLELSTAELLNALEKASQEILQQQKLYEEKLASGGLEVEQLYSQLRDLSDAFEAAKVQHSLDMDQLKDTHRRIVEELTLSSEEKNRELAMDILAARKCCSELQSEVNQIKCEKESLEQEYTSLLQEVNHQFEARITKLCKDFEDELKEAKLETVKLKHNSDFQMEEALNVAQQEIEQLKMELNKYTINSSTKSDASQPSVEHASVGDDIETIQVLQLRLNDLSETKDALRSENEHLAVEVRMLSDECESLRLQLATVCIDDRINKSVLDLCDDGSQCETPSKLRKPDRYAKLMMEKDLLAGMVERLNKEKEQLLTCLKLRPHLEEVFEVDIQHFELRSDHVQTPADSADPAESRIKALEMEKELLANMLEKLSGENERLMMYIRDGENEDSVIDMSCDEVGKIGVGSPTKGFADASCGTEETSCLRSSFLADSAKPDDFELKALAVEQESIVNAEYDEGEAAQFSLDGEKLDQTSNGSFCHITCNDDEETLAIKSDCTVLSERNQACVLAEPENGVCLIKDECRDIKGSEVMAEIERLSSVIRQLSNEKNAVVAAVEQLSDYLNLTHDCLPSFEQLMSAVEARISTAVQQCESESKLAIESLQQQVADQEVQKELALQQVRDILSVVEGAAEVEQTPAQIVQQPCEKLLVVKTDVTGDKHHLGEIPLSQPESLQEEHDKILKELSNAQCQLVEMQMYKDTVAVENEKTIAALIDQVNRVVHEKNELEELATKNVESACEERDNIISGLQTKLSSTVDALQQQNCVAVRILQQTEMLRRNLLKPVDAIHCVSSSDVQTDETDPEVAFSLDSSEQIANMKGSSQDEAALLLENLLSLLQVKFAELESVVHDKLVHSGDSKLERAKDSFLSLPIDKTADAGSKLVDLKSQSEGEIALTAEDRGSNELVPTTDASCQFELNVETVDIAVQCDAGGVCTGSASITQNESFRHDVRISTCAVHGVKGDASLQCDVANSASGFLHTETGCHMNNIGEAESIQVDLDGTTEQTDITLSEMGNLVPNPNDIISDLRCQLQALQAENASLYTIAGRHGELVERLQVELQRLEQIRLEQLKIIENKNHELDVAKHLLEGSNAMSVYSHADAGNAALVEQLLSSDVASLMIAKDDVETLPSEMVGLKEQCPPQPASASDSDDSCLHPVEEMSSTRQPDNLASRHSISNDVQQIEHKESFVNCDEKRHLYLGSVDIASANTADGIIQTVEIKELLEMKDEDRLIKGPIYPVTRLDAECVKVVETTVDLVKELFDAEIHHDNLASLAQTENDQLSNVDAVLRTATTPSWFSEKPNDSAVTNDIGDQTNVTVQYEIRMHKTSDLAPQAEIANVSDERSPVVKEQNSDLDKLSLQQVEFDKNVQLLKQSQLRIEDLQKAIARLEEHCRNLEAPKDLISTCCGTSDEEYSRNDNGVNVDMQQTVTDPEFLASEAAKIALEQDLPCSQGSLTLKQEDNVTVPQPNDSEMSEVMGNGNELIFESDAILKSRISNLVDANHQLNVKTESLQKQLHETEIKLKAAVKKREKVSDELSTSLKRQSNLEELCSQQSASIKLLTQELESVAGAKTRVESELLLAEITSEATNNPFVTDNRREDVSVELDSTQPVTAVCINDLPLHLEAIAELETRVVAVSNERNELMEAIASERANSVCLEEKIRGLELKLVDASEKCVRFERQIEDSLKGSGDLDDQHSETVLQLQNEISILQNELVLVKQEQVVSDVQLEMNAKCDVSSALALETEVNCQREKILVLSDECTNLRDKLATVTQQSQADEAYRLSELSQLQATITNLELQLLAENEEKSKWRDTYEISVSAYSESKNVFENSIANLEDKLNAFKCENDELNRVITCLQAECSHLREEVTVGTQKCQEVESHHLSEFAELQATAGNLERELLIVREDKNRLLKTAEEAEWNHEQLINSHHELKVAMQNNISILEGAVKTLSSENEGLIQTVSCLQCECDELKTRLTDYNCVHAKEVDDLRNCLDSVVSERDALAESLDQAKKDISLADTNYKLLESSLQVKIDELRDNLASQEKQQLCYEQNLLAAESRVEDLLLEKDSSRCSAADQIETLTNQLIAATASVENMTVEFSAQKDSLKLELKNFTEENLRLSDQFMALQQENERVVEQQNNLKFEKHKLEERLALSEEECRCLQKTVADAKKEIDESLQKLDVSGLKMKELDDKLCVVQEDYIQLVAKLTVTKAECEACKVEQNTYIASMEKDVHSLKELVCSLQQEISILNASNKDVDELLKQKAIEMESLLFERDDLTQKLLKFENEEQQLLEQRSLAENNLISEVESMRIEIKQLTSDTNELKRDLQSVTTERDKITEDLALAEKDASVARHHSLAVESSLKLAADELNALICAERQHKLSLEQRLAEAEKIIGELSQDKEMISHANSELTEELHTATARSESLVAEIANLKDQIRLIVENAEQQELTHVEKLQATMEENDRLIYELKVAESEQQTLRNKFELLYTSNSEISVQLAEVDTENKKFRNELIAAEEKIGYLESNLAKITEENNQLVNNLGVAHLECKRFEDCLTNAQSASEISLASANKQLIALQLEIENANIKGREIELSLRAQLEAMTGECNQLKSMVEQKEADLEKLNQHATSCDADISRLENVHLLMESENKLLESKLSTTQCEMSELLSSLSLLNGEKAEMNNRLDDAQKEIDELKQAVDVLKGELSDLRQSHQNEVESVTSQLKTAISERDIFSENITSIKSKFLELEERMVTTTNEKDHVEKRMLLAEKCNADLTDELIVAEQKRVEFTEKLSEADQENTELKRLMNEYRVGKEEAIMAQEAIERECAQLRARLEQTSQNLEADSYQSQYNELQLSFMELQTVAYKLTSDREQLQKENYSLKEEHASIRKLVEVSSVGILELGEQQKLQEYELEALIAKQIAHFESVQMENLQLKAEVAMLHHSRPPVQPVEELQVVNQDLQTDRQLDCNTKGVTGVAVSQRIEHGIEEADEEIRKLKEVVEAKTADLLNLQALIQSRDDELRESSVVIETLDKNVHTLMEQNAKLVTELQERAQNSEETVTQHLGSEESVEMLTEKEHLVSTTRTVDKDKLSEMNCELNVLQAELSFDHSLVDSTRSGTNDEQSERSELLVAHGALSEQTLVEFAEPTLDAGRSELQHYKLLCNQQAYSLASLTREQDQLKFDILQLQQKVLALTEDNQRLAGEAEFAGQMIIEPVPSGDAEVKASQLKQLESQLLMASEENEQLHRAMADLKSGRHHSGIVEGDDSWREGIFKKEDDTAEMLNDLEEQHATELKVLEYRLQESYKSQVAKLRSEVEAELKSIYNQQHEALESEYQVKTEQYKKEMEQKFLDELRKLKRDFSSFEDHSESSMPGEEEVCPLRQKQLVIALQKDNQELHDTRQCLISELDSYRHRVEALQEENSHLMAENERFSNASLKPQHRLATASNAAIDAADGTDWRILSDQQLRQQLSTIDRSSTEICDDDFDIASDSGHHQIVVEGDSTCQSLTTTLPQAVVETGFNGDKLRVDRFQSPRDRYFRHFDGLFQPEERSTSKGMIDTFIHEDSSSELSPSPTFSESAFLCENDRVKSDYDAFRRKAQRDITKLKARLAATVRELSEYKSGTVSLRASSPLLPPAKSTDVYLLQVENDNLKARIADLACAVDSGRRQSPCGGILQVEKETQTAVVAVETDRMFEISVEAVEREVSQVESTELLSVSNTNGSCIDEKCSLLELELAVLRSECNVLKQQNASLEQVIEHFKLAAEKRDRPDVSCAIRNAVHVDAELISAHMTAFQQDIHHPPSVADAIHGNLPAVNCVMSMEHNPEQELYEQKLKQLEKRCESQQSELIKLLKREKLVESTMDKCVQTELMAGKIYGCEQCENLGTRLQNAELLLKVCETSHQLSSSEVEEDNDRLVSGDKFLHNILNDMAVNDFCRPEGLQKTASMLVDSFASCESSQQHVTSRSIVINSLTDDSCDEEVELILEKVTNYEPNKQVKIHQTQMDIECSHSNMQNSAGDVIPLSGGHECSKCSSLVSAVGCNCFATDKGVYFDRDASICVFDHSGVVRCKACAVTTSDIDLQSPSSFADNTISANKWDEIHTTVKDFAALSSIGLPSNLTTIDVHEDFNCDFQVVSSSFADHESCSSVPKSQVDVASFKPANQSVEDADSSDSYVCNENACNLCNPGTSSDALVTPACKSAYASSPPLKVASFCLSADCLFLQQNIIENAPVVVTPTSSSTCLHLYTPTGVNDLEEQLTSPKLACHDGPTSAPIISQSSFQALASNSISATCQTDHNGLSDDNCIVSVVGNCENRLSLALENTNAVNASSTPSSCSSVDGGLVGQLAVAHSRCSNTPSQTLINDSAAILQSVTGLVNQNEDTLRRNRAWTKKLTFEYAKALEELKSVKTKYEKTLDELEHVKSSSTASSVAKRRLVTPQLMSSGKDKRGEKLDLPKVQKELATVKQQLESKCRENRQLQKSLQDQSTRHDADAYNQLRIQYEILLDEKNDLCKKFEEERVLLIKQIEQATESSWMQKDEVRSDDDLKGSDLTCHLLGCEKLTDTTSGLAEWAPQNAGLQRQQTILMCSNSRAHDSSFGLPIGKNANSGLSSTSEMSHSSELPVQQSLLIGDDFSGSRCSALEIPALESELPSMHGKQQTEPSSETGFIHTAGVNSVVGAVDIVSQKVALMNLNDSSLSDELNDRMCTVPVCESVKRSDTDLAGAEAQHQQSVFDDLAAEINIAQVGFCPANVTGATIPCSTSESLQLNRSNDPGLASFAALSKSSLDAYIQCQLLVEEKKELCKKLESAEQLTVKLEMSNKQIGEQLSLLELDCAALKSQLHNCRLNVDIILEEKKELSRQYESLLLKNNEHEIGVLEAYACKEGMPMSSSLKVDNSVQTVPLTSSEAELLTGRGPLWLTTGTNQIQGITCDGLPVAESLPEAEIGLLKTVHSTAESADFASNNHFGTCGGLDYSGYEQQKAVRYDEISNAGPSFKPKLTVKLTEPEEVAYDPQPGEAAIENKIPVWKILDKISQEDISASKCSASLQESVARACAQSDQFLGQPQNLAVVSFTANTDRKIDIPKVSLCESGFNERSDSLSMLPQNDDVLVQRLNVVDEEFGVDIQSQNREVTNSKLLHEDIEAKSNNLEQSHDGLQQKIDGPVTSRQLVDQLQHVQESCNDFHDGQKCSFQENANVASMDDNRLASIRQHEMVSQLKVAEVSRMGANDQQEQLPVAYYMQSNLLATVSALEQDNARLLSQLHDSHCSLDRQQNELKEFQRIADQVSSELALHWTKTGKTDNPLTPTVVVTKLAEELTKVKAALNYYTVKGLIGDDVGPEVQCRFELENQCVLEKRTGAQLTLVADVPAVLCTVELGGQGLNSTADVTQTREPETQLQNAEVNLSGAHDSSCEEIRAQQQCEVSDTTRLTCGNELMIALERVSHLECSAVANSTNLPASLDESGFELFSQFERLRYSGGEAVKNFSQLSKDLSSDQSCIGLQVEREQIEHELKQCKEASLKQLALYDKLRADHEMLENCRSELLINIECLRQENEELMSQLHAITEELQQLKISRSCELADSMNRSSEYEKTVNVLQSRLSESETENSRNKVHLEEVSKAFEVLNNHVLEAVKRFWTAKGCDELPQGRLDTLEATQLTKCCNRLSITCDLLTSATDAAIADDSELRKSSQMLQEKVELLNAECDSMRSQLSVDISLDAGVQELQREVSQLFQVKTDLENEIMCLRGDLDDCKNAGEKAAASYSEERQLLEAKVADLVKLVDSITQSKEDLEAELVQERNEYERNLAAARLETLSKLAISDAECKRIVEQMSNSENQLSGLRDRLRASQDEKDLLQMQLTCVTNECAMQTRQVEDLRNQLEMQREQMTEAMQEHKETLQLLVNLRSEYERGKLEQRTDLSRLEEEILHLEAQIGSSSSVGTPRTMSLISLPSGGYQNCFKRTQSQTSLVLESENVPRLLSCNEIAYKALESKHFVLVEELEKHKRELATCRKEKEYLTCENEALKRQAAGDHSSSERHKWNSASRFREPTAGNFSRFNAYRAQSFDILARAGSAASLTSVEPKPDLIHIPASLINLQTKYVNLERDFQLLMKENTLLREDLLKKQEDVLKKFDAACDKQRKRLFRLGSSVTDNAASLTEACGQQIKILQADRDELQYQLNGLKAKQKNTEELVEEIEQLKDDLNKERQMYFEVCCKKESLEVELFHEKLMVEKHLREFSHLQSLLAKKERLEQRLLERPCSSVDPPAADDGAVSAVGRNLLQSTKSQIVVEIRRKVLYRDVAVQIGESFIAHSGSSRNVRIKNTAAVIPSSSAGHQKLLRLDCGCTTELGTLKLRVECRYHQAVEKLRRELRSQDTVASACTRSKPVIGRGGKRY